MLNKLFPFDWCKARTLCNRNRLDIPNMAANSSLSKDHTRGSTVITAGAAMALARIAALPSGKKMAAKHPRDRANTSQESSRVFRDGTHSEAADIILFLAIYGFYVWRPHPGIRLQKLARSVSSPMPAPPRIRNHRVDQQSRRRCRITPVPSLPEYPHHTCRQRHHQPEDHNQ